MSFAPFGGHTCVAHLSTVDALARLQLLARRAGCRIRVVDAPADLADLVAFVGLTQTLGVEPRRQPEQREERLGVEEERELDDPAV
jgi:gamma-glutamyl:cysteine ligase YbdK (ATP-grasp superfamily)